MFTRTALGVIMIITVASDAFAASKRQRSVANPNAGSRATGLCAQSGPITMPAVHPDCNRRGWLSS
jgi:hypothetical protein